MVVFEPSLDADELIDSEMTHDLEAFKADSDTIVARRLSDEIADVVNKVMRGTCLSKTRKLGCLHLTRIPFRLLK